LIDKAEAEAVAYVIPLMKEAVQKLINGNLVEAAITWDAIKAIGHTIQLYRYYEQHDYKNVGVEIGNII